MAECSGPLSPNNHPGPSGGTQGEQEKQDGSKQETNQALYDTASNDQYMENSESYIQTEAQFSVPYEDSDSDDGLDVVYGPNPPPSNIYVTLKPLIFFVFFSTIFMAVAVGMLLLAILIVHLMLDK